METPDSMYGRLLEAAHVSGYSFKRAHSDLKWLLEEDRWKKVGNGFDDIDEFLKTIDFSEFKVAIDQRKDLAKKLKDLRATQRATARALGVGLGTVQRDIDPNGSPTQKRPQENQALTEVVDPNGSKSPPSWITQSGEKAADSAQKAAQKEDAAKETKKRREVSRNAAPYPDGMDYRVGDAREVLSDIPNESVHLVLTDPPYGDGAESLYVWLAEWSRRVLVPGGSMICFTGQSRLDRDMRILGEQLRYWWLLALRHNQAQRLPGKFVMAEFKPVLWFVKEHRRGRTLVNDVLRSDRRDKQGHDWGQGDGGVELLIEQLTEPDEMIVDPFAGTGRWGEIANRMGRQWIGADIVQGGISQAHV